MTRSYIKRIPRDIPENEVIPWHIKNNVEKITESGCWIWMGGLTTAGYGSVRINKKVYYTHILFTEYYKGKIPDGLECSHICHIRSCCNPDHIIYETGKENCNRGGVRNKKLSGENSSSAKLTAEQVREAHELRQAGWFQREIGDKFGVDRGTIKSLLRGQSWHNIWLEYN